MPEITTDDGVRLHYIVSGRGPVGIICLHPMGGHVGIWRELWKSMATELGLFRQVAFDFRGHGGSGGSACTLSNERLARDALCVADAVGLERFAIAGHSLGGKIGMMLAALAPGRVTGLVLIGTPGPGCVPFKREDLANFFDRYADVAVTREFFRSWFVRWPRPAIDAWMESFSRYSRPVLEAMAELAIWTDIRPQVGVLRGPALIIAGADDPVYGPTYQTSDVLPYVPGAEMIVIEQCGHGLIVERPDAIAKHMTGFLRDVAAG